MVHPMQRPLQRPWNGIQKNDCWMSALPEVLWAVPLYNLCIPGSHDAMSFCLDENSPIDPRQSKTLKMLDKKLPCIIRPIIYKWSTTQELSVSEQLDSGIRYLDLRIAHKPDDASKNLYFIHMLFTTMTVEDALKEMSNWLEFHPKEALILACRQLHGMTVKHHKHLISCLKRTFGLKLCPKTENPTLQNMWQKGYQVVVSYEDCIAEKYAELWPPVPYWWGNTTRTQALICYLEKKKQQGRPGGFFVAGINLTENLWYILKHPFGSLKKLTVPKLPCLGDWVQNQCPGSQQDGINIIAGDFIEIDHFVNDVIELNHKYLHSYRQPTVV
ncbi:PI-PLC X domain-containing protein 1 isoform X2 [Ambystoma mexicanum]